MEVSAKKMRRVTTPSVNAQQSTKESFVTGQPIIALQCHVKTVEFVIQMTLMMATHVNACQVSVLRDYCLTVCLSVCPYARLFLKKKSESLQNITFFLVLQVLVLNQWTCQISFLQKVYVVVFPFMLKYKFSFHLNLSSNKPIWT